MTMNEIFKMSTVFNLEKVYPGKAIRVINKKTDEVFDGIIFAVNCLDIVVIKLNRNTGKIVRIPINMHEVTTGDYDLQLLTPVTVSQ